MAGWGLKVDGCSPRSLVEADRWEVLMVSCGRLDNAVSRYAIVFSWKGGDLGINSTEQEDTNSVHYLDDAARVVPWRGFRPKPSLQELRLREAGSGKPRRTGIAIGFGNTTSTTPPPPPPPPSSRLQPTFGSLLGDTDKDDHHCNASTIATRVRTPSSFVGLSARLHLDRWTERPLHPSFSSGANNPSHIARPIDNHIPKRKGRREEDIRRWRSSRCRRRACS